MSRFSRKLKTASLMELENECYGLVGSNFGHNMIAIILSEVEKRFGQDQADRIKDNVDNL